MSTTALHLAERHIVERHIFDNIHPRIGSVFRICIGLLVLGPTILSVEKASATEPRHANPTATNQVGRIDWTTMPSSYTHTQGARVNQFAQGVQPVIYERPDYQRSGFRHFRSSLQVGNSADHIHIVDQWGPSVRPYGEWRYPYRPYSVPYPGWGPQLPQTSVNANFNQQLQFPNGMPSGMPSGPPGAPPGMPGGNVYGPLGPSGNQPVGVPSGWPYSSGGYGFGPGGYYPGAYNYNPYAGGPNGFGQFGQNGGNFGVGQYGVGPANALRTDQDEYYQDAPQPPQMNDRDFFFSPGR